MRICLQSTFVSIFRRTETFVSAFINWFMTGVYNLRPDVGMQIDSF